MCLLYIYVTRHHVALRSRSVCRKVDSPEKGEVRPGIVVRVLGEREGREGGETSGTSADPGAVKAGRPRSFSGADPGRAASRDRSGVWGNGEGERRHGSLEGVGGLKTNEAYHSKADALLIPEM